ncbi:MAG: cytochrome c oxidase subunit II [Pseudomonadota bacterium]
MVSQKLRRIACLMAVVVLSSFGWATPVWAEWVLNMPVGVTPISREAYGQHMLMLWWCIGIGIVVFGAMGYSIVKHRKAAGFKAAQFHHSTFAEIAWTAIPVLILVTMAIPATKALIIMEDTKTEAEMTLKVTGYQWKWRYDYIEDDVTVWSNLAQSSRDAMYKDPTKVENYMLEVDNAIYLPTNTKVRILLTADDVIHAWWVPELGQKKDAIPGFINEIWTRIEEEGVYRGQCAELCGRDHGFMPIVVHAVSPEAYKEWVAEQKGAKLAGREKPASSTEAPAIASTPAAPPKAAPEPQADSQPLNPESTPVLALQRDGAGGQPGPVGTAQ